MMLTASGYLLSGMKRLQLRFGEFSLDHVTHSQFLRFRFRAKQTILESRYDTVLRVLSTS
jgi:hypothetical protein